MIVTALTTTSTLFREGFNKPVYLALTDNSKDVIELTRMTERNGDVFFKVKQMTRAEAELHEKLRKQGNL